MKKIFSKKNAMASGYPWRLFAFYLVVSILASVSILPYLLTLLDLSGNPLPVPLSQIITDQILQSAIILVPAIGVGLLLAERVGLDSPYLRALLYKEKTPAGFPAVLGLSLVLGFLASILIAIIDLLFIRDAVLSNIQQVQSIPVAWRFLTAFYGGVAEEILMRLFLMTLIAWIVWTFRKGPQGKSTAMGMWIAVVLSALIFGLSHLPVTSALTDISGLVILRALLLNGIAGGVFGWLYWKKGLEAAMIAHFGADITLQILVPGVIGLFA